MKVRNSKKLSTAPLTGVWYRSIDHQHFQTALQSSHTKNVASRFNGGVHAKHPCEIFYLAENHSLALSEVDAEFQTTDGTIVPNPKAQPLVLNVDVKLQSVTDLTIGSILQLLDTTLQELTGQWDQYQHLLSPELAPTQQLGQALFRVPGLEAFCTFSSKRPKYKNLVVFREKLRKGSELRFENKITRAIDVVQGTN